LNIYIYLANNTFIHAVDHSHTSGPLFTVLWFQSGIGCLTLKTLTFHMTGSEICD